MGGLSELLTRFWYLLVRACVQHSGTAVDIQETACSAVWQSSLSICVPKYLYWGTGNEHDILQWMFVCFLIMHHVDHLKKKTSNSTGMWCKNTETICSHHNRCHNSCSHNIKSKVSAMCANVMITTLEFCWQMSVKIQPAESKLFFVDRQACQRQ